MNDDPTFLNDSSSAQDHNKNTDEDPKSDFFSHFVRLLESTSLCNILQSHTKILVADSRVPFNICLKSLSNYHRCFSFVYDVEKTDVCGYIDELSIIQFLKNYDKYADLTCSEFLRTIKSENLYRLSDEVTAYEGFDLIRKNVTNRVFVWSNERNAPIGFVTPSCYLFYLIRNLRGKHDIFDLPLSSLSIDRNFNKVSNKKTLNEVLDLLTSSDNLCVTDDKGRIIGVLTRAKIAFYFLELFKNELSLDYSTDVFTIIHQMDKRFYHKIQPLHVDSSVPMRKAIANLLLSNDRTLVYTDESGSDVVVTIWDIIQFLVVN